MLAKIFAKYLSIVVIEMHKTIMLLFIVYNISLKFIPFSIIKHCFIYYYIEAKEINISTRYNFYIFYKLEWLK